MKPLVLLSFSLSFLTQGIANDFSHAKDLPDAELPLASEPLQKVFSNREKNQVKEEERAVDQMISFEDDNYLSDAEEPEVEPMSSQPAIPVGEWCLSPYHQMHVSIRHNEAEGIGYNKGYTTLEAFGIYDGYGSSFMPFVDIRGHVFNDGKLAGNLGIGERTIFSSIEHTLGAYLYYDVRGVGRGLTINQLSPGLELVGERMEYRINGYFPLGNQEGHLHGFKFDEFEGHSIILKGKQQRAMKGFDAEIGAHLTESTKYDVYAAAGTYYLHAPQASSWGGRTRLLGRYKEYVTLEVSYSYDHLFHSVVQGSVALTLPFGRKLQYCGKCCPQNNNLLLSRAAFAPSRFEIPVAKEVHKREKAIDPATGQPWRVWFVKNTSHSAGTYESPFATLLAAQNASSPNDMIYVFPGDGTTNGMNAGITLKDGQTFFGSGIKQQFSTTKGTMTIPAYTSTNPTITNTTGSGVVILGNGDVVSGFNIASSTAGVFGIDTPAGGINGARIINNIVSITTVASNGISVDGFGTVIISNNQVTNSTTSGSGITASSVGGTMSGEISNNSISGFINGMGFNDALGGSTVTFEGNTITNFSGDGIFVNPMGQAMYTIIGNTINNLGTNGIDINSGGTTSAHLVIANNNISVSGLGQRGIFVNMTSALSFLNANILNNSVQSTPTFVNNFDLRASNTATICLSLNNNTAVTVPTDTAFNIDATGGTINISSMEGNIGTPIISTGNVNFVAPGPCGN